MCGDRPNNVRRWLWSWSSVASREQRPRQHGDRPQRDSGRNDQGQALHGAVPLQLVLRRHVHAVAVRKAAEVLGKLLTWGRGGGGRGGISTDC